MPQRPRDRTTGAAKLTYDDLASLPEDGKRYEVLEGDLVVTALTPTRHQIVAANLGALLHAYARASGLGRVLFAPTDVILDAHTIVQPDILFVAEARAGVIQRHAIVGAPDLVVEVLSPATARRDRGLKAKLYARFGVAHYWIVDPDAHTLEAFSRAENVFVSGGTHAGDAVVRMAPFDDLAIELLDIWS